MAINLFEHQKNAIKQLRSGSILVGGVGSGKSRTALAYYFIVECEGKIKINDSGGYAPMKKPKDLYIITTARKRDTLEWEQEYLPFNIQTKIVVDSWNNISKYVDIKNAFFIFDEQRVCGSGAWVKSFLTITKFNRWILLSATPGDTWSDYIPVFIANGFYKNRTSFLRRHAVFSRFTKYPKIEKYLDVGLLISLREKISVVMNYKKHTISHEEFLIVPFNKEDFDKVLISRWNIYEKRPIKTVSELCYLMRKVVNSDPRRISVLETLYQKHKKLIVFYNFDYELELLLSFSQSLKLSAAQWNGHKHEPIPKTESWMYFVQYTAGAEGWNCIETNTIIFYSQSYSYKATIQAAGRINRLNTPYTDLYFYFLRSNSTIDLAIQKCFSNKKDFNENNFMSI